jgi:hypothetical protein
MSADATRLPVEHLLAAAEAFPAVSVLACELFADGSGLSVLVEHYGRRVACSFTGSAVVRPCVGPMSRRPVWQWESSARVARRVFEAMIGALTDEERSAIAAMYADSKAITA